MIYVPLICNFIKFCLVLKKKWIKTAVERTLDFTHYFFTNGKVSSHKSISCLSLPPRQVKQTHSVLKLFNCKQWLESIASSYCEIACSYIVILAFVVSH